VPNIQSSVTNIGAKDLEFSD